MTATIGLTHREARAVHNEALRQVVRGGTDAGGAVALLERQGFHALANDLRSASRFGRGAR